MSLLLTPLALAFLSSGGVELKTQYTADKSLRVRAETSIEMETTAFSMERDGEPVEPRGGMGGGMTSERVVAYVDTVKAVQDGAPQKVARHFEEVESSGSFGSGEFQRDFDQESPLVDQTMILARDGDEIAVELESGAPENPEVLKGHHLELPLDALLPGREVAPGETWEPEGADLLEAMILDVESSLFPRPTEEEGGGPGGGRGGFRSGRGGGRGIAFFSTAEWEIKAKLAESREAVDGLECAVIELTAEAEGDLPEPSFGRGRDRFSLGHSLHPWRVLGAADNTFEVALEGKLYFSVEKKRPVKLELEGEFTLETGFEREGDGVSMSMSRTDEGQIELSLSIEDGEL